MEIIDVRRGITKQLSKLATVYVEDIKDKERLEKCFSLELLRYDENWLSDYRINKKFVYLIRYYSENKTKEEILNVFGKINKLWYYNGKKLLKFNGRSVILDSWTDIVDGVGLYYIKFDFIDEYYYEDIDTSATEFMEDLDIGI